MRSYRIHAYSENWSKHKKDKAESDHEVTLSASQFRDLFIRTQLR